jgi:hypothetical protein
MAQVNWTRQAGLAAALLALGTTAYWLEYKHKPQKESQDEQSKKVFNLKDTQVKVMSWSDGAGHAYEIRCSDATAALCKPGENSKWELTLPLKLKADDANANALVSALNNLTVGETIDLKEETPEKRAALLREYGLDAQSRSLPSTKKIEVDTPSGATVLYLGANHPIGDSIFGILETSPNGQKPSGKAEENRVYLVPTYFKANFEHDLTYWRDKKIMTLPAHEVESFKLSSTKANLSGEKKDGQWALKTSKGEEVAGDIENIDGILSAASFLTAKNVVADKKSDPKAQTALKGTKSALTLVFQQEKGSNKELPPAVTLTLYRKGEAAARSKSPIAQTGAKLYATVSNLDPLFELEANSIDRLNKELKDLRLAKLITSMERFTAKSLVFSGKPVGPSLIVLKNHDGKWAMEGEKVEPNNDRIQGLLDKLSGNRIQEFLQGTAVPAGELDALILKLGDDKEPAKREIAFWKNGGKLYARNRTGGKPGKEAFLVDQSLQADLPWNHDFFMKKDAPPVAPPPHAAPAPKAPEPGGPAGSPPEPGEPLIPVPPAPKTK